MIVNRTGELLAANASCDVFFEDVASELLEPPVNTRRIALHPAGMAPRVLNFEQWAPHVTEGLRRECARSSDPLLEALLSELERYTPPASPGPDHVGIAVPLCLRTRRGELRLITILTSFVTATDVTLGELRLEAFLPVDQETMNVLEGSLNASNRLKPNVALSTTARSTDALDVQLEPRAPARRPAR